MPVDGKKIREYFAEKSRLERQGIGLKFYVKPPDDKGPWVVSPDGSSIDSEDFTHDVRLKVTGDFFNSEQRKRYADNLAVKLNNNQ